MIMNKNNYNPGALVISSSTGNPRASGLGMIIANSMGSLTVLWMRLPRYVNCDSISVYSNIRYVQDWLTVVNP